MEGVHNVLGLEIPTGRGALMGGRKRRQVWS